MPRTNKESPPARASPQAERSPEKAKKPVPMRKKKTPLTIYVINFGPPFSFEIYFYEKNGSEDGLYQRSDKVHAWE